MEYQLPKYKAIANSIIEKINNKEFPPGSRIPSENEIIKNFSVSNTTARKVLQEIENGGWVVKIQGKGTIVNDFIVGRNASKILSFTRNMRDMGLEPSTQLIESGKMNNDVSITVGRKVFIIKRPVFRISRLRKANNIPLMHEIRYISMILCPRIEELDLEKSLYSIYQERYKLGITRINQDLSAIILDEFYRDLFDAKQIIPGMQVTGVTFCGDDQILEGEESVYRGDKYKFMVQAVTGRNNLRF